MELNGFFNILNQVDSTNNYAMGIVHAGMAEAGMAWMAHTQTAGRGQRGRQWLDEPGQNIALSVVLKPHQAFRQQPFALSMAVALVCKQFFAGFAGDESCIKWPNDLYWRDRKAGGILIENVYNGSSWQWAVVGVGININQVVFAAELKKAVSLRQITGKNFSIEQLARELHLALTAQVAGIAEWPAGELCSRYNECLYGAGRVVRLKKGAQVFETRITGVSPSGHLLAADVLNREFAVGEISWE